MGPPNTVLAWNGTKGNSYLEHRERTLAHPPSRLEAPPTEHCTAQLSWIGEAMSSKVSRGFLVMLAIVLLLGLFLRTHRYLANISVYFDEALNCVAVVDADFGDILSAPVNHLALCAPGFNVLQKVSTMMFGTHERALRLVPLLAGILALPLVYRLARFCLPPWASLAVVAATAVSEPLIHWCAQAKPYSFDVLVAASLAWLTLGIARRVPRRRARWWTLVVGGLVAPWFSHPAIFVLAGAGMVLLWEDLREGNAAAAFRTVGIGVGWLASFALMQWLFVGPYLEHNTGLHEFWKRSGGFAPDGLTEWPGWFVEAFVRMVDSPLGLTLPGVTFVVLFLGVLHLACSDKRALVALSAPIALVLAAACAQQYPFHTRLILWLTPFILVLLGGGIAWLSSGSSRRRGATVAGLVVAATLLIGPTRIAIERARKPPWREHLRPVLEQVVESKNDSDAVYIFSGAAPSYDYYSRCHGLDLGDVTIGGSHRRNPEDYEPEVKRFEAFARTWVVLTHVDADERDRILGMFDRFAQRTREIESHGAWAYLYVSVDSLEDAFVSLPTVVFRLDATNREQIDYHKHMKRIEPDGNELVAIEAIDVDPYMYLPPVAAPPGAQVLARIEIECPADTRMEFLYQTATEHTFSHHRSVVRRLAQGRNLIYFYLPETDIQGPIRIDPGNHALGRYGIHALELRAAGPADN